MSATVLLVAVFFAATFIRSALGFGEALIAVPLLAFTLPVTVVAPVASLASITVAAVVLIQDRQHVHIGSAIRLVLSTMVGIPFGLLLLRFGPEVVVKAVLGLVVTAFAASSLRSRWQHELVDDRFAWLFGFSAGVLGGAYGMNGPPLVVYGSLRRWPPERFRATLQGYFLPASLMGMAGYWAAGLWTPSVSRYYLISLPAVLPAIFFGRAINQRVDTRRFSVLIHYSLIISGAALFLQAIAAWLGRQM